MRCNSGYQLYQGWVPPTPVAACELAARPACMATNDTRKPDSCETGFAASDTSPWAASANIIVHKGPFIKQTFHCPDRKLLNSMATYGKLI
jgi:hypothetical protein